jgi:hypothetical protein
MVVGSYIFKQRPTPHTNALNCERLLAEAAISYGKKNACNEAISY